MAISLRHLIGLGALLLSVALVGLHAQTNVAPKESPTFTVYAPGDASAWGALFYLPAKQEPVKLGFRGNSRSAVLKVASTTQPLVFGVEKTDPTTQQKTYMPVATVAWPDAATVKALLVFAVETGATGPQLRVLALDDGITAFPLRTVRIFNATGRPLMAKVAGFEGEAPVGVSSPHPYPVVSDDPNQVGSFPLAFAINDPQAGAKLLHSGYGEAWPFGRSLVFVLPPKKTGAGVQLRTLVDAPPVPKT
jgi:hypothetical protein